MGDLDGDNDLDAFVTHYLNDPNKIYLNDGKGGFLVNDLELGRFNSIDAALADLDNDGDLDLLETNSNIGVVVRWNLGELSFRDQIIWGRQKDKIFIDVADMNGDGQHDILVTSYDNKLSSTLTLLLNEGEGNFRPVTIAQDLPAQPKISRLKDMDKDGDMDIIFELENGEKQWYVNNFQGGASQIDNRPGLLVGMPPLQDNPTCPVIPIPYQVNDPENTPTYIRVEYSYSGGGQWFAAEVLSDTAKLRYKVICKNLDLEVRKDIFLWDTFASGFYGQSNNVVLRFTAQSQPIQAEIMHTVQYTNQVAGPYQTAPSVAVSPVFRVRGAQIQVFTETLDSPASGAAVYLLREGNQTAQLMGNPIANRPLTTDEQGYLNGRGSLIFGDKLLAMLPVSQTYRIPPQLVFDGSGSAEVKFSSAPVNKDLTAEFWFYPQSETGSLFSLGNQLKLSFARIAKTTAVTLTIAKQTLTYSLPLHDGKAHHLAISWDGSSKEARLTFDGEKTITDTFTAAPTFTNALLRLGEGYTGSLDEIRLWDVVRNRKQISETRFTSLSSNEPGLVGYWPIKNTDQRDVSDFSGNVQTMTLQGGTAVAYKPLYTLYHTSGTITNTDKVTSTINGVQFKTVITPGVQQLIVSEKNPLILFDLDVSLEWDARNDTNFLRDLQDSFRDASALLYDVSNGQMALGQINLFHDKAYWSTADIVIYADNSLRPSAAIGGVFNSPISETVKVADTKVTASKTITEAYRRGQIRMGTSWDPYGETTADLGAAWNRTLAHELAHYLLFLPDNYLGINNGGVFHLVNCPGSFMTTANDPSYSEFLTEVGWDKGECQSTLAATTTGRNDWATINKFYPMLFTPTKTISGPTDLPLAVTTLLPWAFTDQEPPFPARNFDIRSANGSNERLRLPNGQAYLIKTQGTIMPMPEDDDALAYLTDDQLIILGSPTGGGRLDVRGAAENDKLCLFDSSQGYAGCINQVTRNTVAVHVAQLWPALKWQPNVVAYALDATRVAVTVTQPLTDGDRLMVQLFPRHYGSVPGNAPATSFAYADDEQTLVYTAVLTMQLPAYETAVRVWVEPNKSCNEKAGNYTCLRESVTIFRLNPKEWEVTTNLNIQAPPGPLEYVPLTLGPNSLLIGGPDSSLVGGPDSSLVGGAGRVLWGNPDSSLVGGALILGNPDSSLVGGAGLTLRGNPDSSIVGGAEIIGNPDSSIVGGGNLEAAAPIISTDAQVVIYNKAGLFEKNGVESIQALATVPYIETHPWLVPVGQAYEVKLAEVKLADDKPAKDEPERFISFTYLQREVPEGYEHTLAVYFLPEKEENWIRQNDSVGFVENLIVTKLDKRDGIYAIMSTISLPELKGGEWNLLAYPLPDCRPWQEAPLASLADRVDGLLLVENQPQSGASALNSLPEAESSPEIVVEQLEPGRVYWIHITPGENIIPYLTPPIRKPNGEFRGCQN